MKLRYFLVFCLFVVLVACVYGATGVADKGEAKALCDAAMKRILAEDVPGAFQVLRGKWTLPSSEVDNLVTQTVAQRSMIGARFGKPLGTAFIREEEFPDLVLRFTYVEKRENHCLRWQFSFYKPEDRWYFNGVKWDDNLVGILDQGQLTSR